MTARRRPQQKQEQQEAAPQQRIKSVTVYWPEDRVEEYDDVVGFATDMKLGFPRLSVHTSTGRIDNINLNTVEMWTVEVENLQ